ncbi:Staphylococcal nuclease family protein [Phage NCTB]|nr:Staphylococcal nuclease family protein [Phage NCTB]
MKELISYKYQGFVERVVDGDTFDIRIDLGFYTTTTQRIRLAEIDTPETYRPKTEAERTHGQKATDFVTRMIENKQVFVESVKRGKYRFVAKISYQDPDTKAWIDLGTKLKKEGLVKLDSYPED